MSHAAINDNVSITSVAMSASDVGISRLSTASDGVPRRHMQCRRVHHPRITVGIACSALVTI